MDENLWSMLYAAESAVVDAKLAMRDSEPTEALREAEKARFAARCRLMDALREPAWDEGYRSGQYDRKGDADPTNPYAPKPLPAFLADTADDVPFASLEEGKAYLMDLCKPFTKAT